MRRVKAKRPYPLLFLALTLLPVVYAYIVGFGPFLLMVYYSLFNYFMGRKLVFTGLSNYQALLMDKDLLSSIGLTIGYMSVVTICELVIGLIIGYFLYRINRGKSTLTLLILLPMIFTPSVAGIVWRILFDPAYGHVDFYLGLLGIPPIAWLTKPLTALLSMIIVDIWQWSSFVVLIVFSGLSAIPRDPIEAASVDGATGFRLFRNILLPYIKPLVYIVIFFRMIDSFKIFDIPYIMTRGGPGISTSFVSIYAYNDVFVFLDVGYACAIGVVIFLIAYIFSTVLMRRIGPTIWGD